MKTSPSLYRRQLLKMSLVGVLAPSLISCSQAEKAYRAQILVFGTEVNLEIFHSDKELINSAIGKINRDFQRFHHEWHAWEKGGIISKINQAIKQDISIEVADSVKNFVIKSQKLSQESDYLFDPGIGRLISLWGFHSEHWQGPPPNKTAIQTWLSERPSIKDIYFEGSNLFCRNRNVQLDFGGNAKGLALDMALQSLKESGIEHALVSIGGDMKSLGIKPNGAPWKVAISNPHQATSPIAALDLNANESVVTSGTYQRFFEWQGKRYSHILNPNTGYPADGFASVTVIHPDATTADSAATALMVAGAKQWRQIADQMQVQYVFCIDHDGNFQQTKAMEKRIKLI